MSRRADRKSKPNPAGGPLPEPVNVVDGVPDRAERPGRGTWVLMVVVFAAWTAVLIYCQIAG